MPPRLIRTKILIPSFDDSIVPRHYLGDHLDKAKERKLALISAPAGFGKTTAVASWLLHSNDATAWLSLDKSDNDLLLFLRYFIEAVHRVLPGTLNDTLQSLHMSQSLTADEIVPVLLHNLESVDSPLFIVLDDYHLIHDVQIHDLMRLLIKRLPTSIHLVLITRIDPPLPLPSLRVQNQLVELRGQDLRFSDFDARRFLISQGQTLIDQVAANRLNRHLDGWIAGLQLASLALKAEGRNDGLLSEADVVSGDLLTEYLIDEVLGHLPETTQLFLQVTSILDRFSVPLCLAVLDGTITTKEDDVQAILEELKRANLFVITIDSAGGWYRYHHLFQRTLRRRLMASDTESVDEFHRRAATWYADNGFIEEALQHFLATDDLTAAVTLVEAHCHNFLNGMERQTLERWMSSLPDEIIWQRPTLLTAKAWLFYRHWRLDSLDEVLRSLGSLLGDRPAYLEAKQFENLRGHYNALRSATLFHVHMDFDGAIRDAELAMKALSKSEGGALSTAILHRAMAQIGNGQRERPLGDLATIIRSPAPSGPAKVQAFLGLAFSYYMLGDLNQLERLSEHAQLRSIEEKGRGRMAHWFSGQAALERNRLTDSVERIEHTYRTRQRTNFLAGFYAACALARIAQIRRRYAEAQSIISDLYVDSGRLDHGRFLEVLDAFQAYQWMLTGEVESALRWASAYDPVARNDLLLVFDSPGFMWSRILTMHGSDEDRMLVRTYLNCELHRIRDSEFVRRRVQLLAHLSGISAVSGNLAEAQNYLRTAVDIAQPLGLIRSIADVGAPLTSLLQQLLPDRAGTTFVSQVLDAILESEPLNTPVAINGLLTQREHEILDLMRTGSSNQEIAEKLIISVHTVKRHATNIYNKLTVDNRQEAIYRAMELGILTWQG